MSTVAMPQTTKVARAIEHGRLLLSAGPMLSSEFSAKMAEAGFSRSVIVDARRHLGVVAKQLEIYRRWEIRLPDDNDVTDSR